MKKKLSPGWKRLNKCQAYYHHKMYLSDCTKGARQYTVEHNTWYLYSYRAPVVVMSSHHSQLFDHTNWHIYVNKDYWQYSNTTRQHVSKFISRVVGAPIWYGELKEVVTQIQKSVFRDAICPTRHNVRVFVMSNEEMQKIFESNTPYCNKRYD